MDLYIHHIRVECIIIMRLHSVLITTEFYLRTLLLKYLHLFCPSMRTTIMCNVEHIQIDQDSYYISNGGIWCIYASDISWSTQSHRITRDYVMVKLTQTNVICMFYTDDVQD